jgi:hypothetical protein
MRTGRDRRFQHLQPELPLIFQLSENASRPQSSFSAFAAGISPHFPAKTNACIQIYMPILISLYSFLDFSKLPLRYASSELFQIRPQSFKFPVAAGLHRISSLPNRSIGGRYCHSPIRKAKGRSFSDAMADPIFGLSVRSC